jgi:hypothetical protein
MMKLSRGREREGKGGGGGEEKQHENQPQSLHLYGCSVYTLFIVVVYNEPSWEGGRKRGERGERVWLTEGWLEVVYHSSSTHSHKMIHQ